jgi:signal transduction histidine kinase
MLRMGLLCLCLLTLTVQAQYNPFYVPQNLPDRDSLKAIVQTTKDPIQKLIALRELGHAYYENKRDSALFYFEQSATTARSINSKLWEADAFNSIGFVSYIQGNYPRALQFLTQAMVLAENPDSEKGEWKPRASGFISPSIARLSILARCYQHRATLYSYSSNPAETAELQLSLYRKALAISTSIGDKTMMGIINMNTSRHFSLVNNLDSVLFYQARGLQLMKEAGYERYIGTMMFILGEAYRRNQQPEKAKTCYWSGIQAGRNIQNTRSVADNTLALANLLLAQGNADSAIYYGYNAVELYRSTLILAGLADSYAALSSAFNAKNNIDSAFHYQGLSLATRKELDAEEKSRRFQQLAFDEQLKAQEAAENDRRFRNRIIMSILLAGLAILAGIGIFLYRNNIARKKANQLLAQKNRELEIESSLDRVRTRAMALHKSEELHELIATVYQELVTLDITLNRCFIMINHKGSGDTTWWMASQENPHVQRGYLVPYHQQPPYLAYLDAWQQGQEKLLYIFEGQEKEDWDKVLFEETELKQLPDFAQAGMRSVKKVYWYSSFNKFGCLGIGSLERLSDQSFDILQRFSRVFEQTYTRFLDLQKAEAQAREAQIEAALERVRSRSLAMHHTEELQDVVNVAAQQLLQMNIDIDGGMFIAINDEVKNDLPFWAAAGAADYVQKVTVPYIDRPAYTGLLNAIKQREPFYTEFYSKEDKDEFLQHMFKFPPWNQNSEERKLELIAREGGYTRSVSIGRYTSIGITNHHGKIFSDAENEVLKRFGAVLEQAYTRFMDLQKAEAQAREAQIEAALERVRSRAMAMHSSTELSEVVHELRKQMGLLGQKDLDTCVIHLNETSQDYIDAWAAIRPPNSAGEILEATARVPKKGLLLIEEALEAYNQNRKDYVIINEGEKIRQWFSFIQKESPRTFDMILESTRDVTGDMLRAYWSFSDFPGGSLLMVTGDPPDGSSRALLRRFANVFGLAYRRFADLIQAEAQARESKIETSLERLRTKTMAMNNSDDVGETVVTMFAEFVHLGIQTSRCGILIFDDEEKVEVWTARSNADGKATLIIGELNLHAHDLIESGYYSWKEKQSSQSYFLQGKNLIDYYDALNRSDFYPVKFDLNNLPSEEEFMIMKRFAGVFGQTYRRYLDLKKAEASAKEAIKQAALDRIRADIASMRTKQDLDRITPLIWNELTTLNIPFIRCGIFIMDDDQQQIHTFLSNPEGRAIASFNLPYGNSGNISDVVNHWQNNKTYVEHWQIEEFTALADSLVQLGEIATREQYMQSLPPGGIYLHFVPFLQGMLYAGNLTRLSDDDISLLQAVADAFSTAYARYEDFNKVENTLNDLRQTQKQLVQAEKMASLGELTAGIAHEIQNPLNFVNNFAEVNTELNAEGREAIERKDWENAEEILGLLSENNQKILHHGKRADAIVKGMLLHSRSSSGAKEPTDVNALCDEYLRLAYHGLRAKDSTFNATMKTEFDETIGKINIIPQDMGRVLLNLINNAFYAVDEKKKQIGGSYEPEVTLSTRMVSAPNHSIIISVRDNGHGIPQNIVDKIFQPFFTTKPTGEGTGLGLSLSYDIVKAHGGEIIVESKEGEGTIFSVVVPVG